LFVSVEISLDVIPGKDRVTDLDVKKVEGKVELIAAIGIKMNPRKWVKHGYQVGDQLKLKTVVLHDDHDKEIRMT